MRYLSDDGKVFQTEQECLEYEKKQKIDQLERQWLPRLTRSVRN